MNVVEPLRDKDDIQAMKDYLSSWNEKYYMLFLLGINTGFRVGDILKLKVKDVQGWHIKVREQKTGKYKSIKMTRPLKNELREFVKDKELHEYLFQSRVGKNKALSYKTVYWFLKRAAEDLGIDNVGTHTMRKTFGYHYYKKYKNVADLMSLFNHSSPAVTLIYICVRQDELDTKMSNFSL